MKKALIAIFTLLLPFITWAQNEDKGLKEVAFEFQAYPAGVMPGLRADYSLNSFSEINIRLGANIAKRQDWGEHDNEEGNGLGLSLGYRYKIKKTRTGPFVGARVDMWWMTIDWENYLPTGPVSVKGSTDITILQPTMEFGWKFNLGTSWMVAPVLAFGQEINIKTKGEEVGQGGISLIGFTLGKKF